MLFRSAAVLVPLGALLIAFACTISNPDFDGESSATVATSDGSSTSISGTSTSGGSSTSDTGTSTADASSDSVSASSGATGEAGTESDGVSSSSSTTGCVEVELYPDVDGDSYGDIHGAPSMGCLQDGYAEMGGDCDDINSSIHPGADEICNALDDDCDGLLDEYSELNAEMCNGCKVREWGGHLYWMCPGPVDWETARAGCILLGADLTIVASGDENGFLFDNMMGTNQWLGARDTKPGFAEYTWVDGSALDFDAWTGPNPDEDNGCAQMSSNDSSYWRDRDCGQSYGFACETLP